MTEKKTYNLCFLQFIVTVFILWALWFSLPTPCGNLELDIFPPAIRLQ